MEEKEIQTWIKKAIKAREHAYAPYSKFLVGAVLMDETGREYTGVNVENTSYGLSSCAERNSIFSAVAQGMKKIALLCVVGDTEEPICPCGACRQVILEFATQDTKIILSNLQGKYEIYSIDDLLPKAFFVKRD
ncbi:MAG TPA: cytidine deaminase [Fusobacterium sp.]|uniref:cytidine deaminase n=1 Tax=Fusobacterium sp. TaxID=68766 RepID=UPI002F3E618C